MKKITFLFTCALFVLAFASRCIAGAPGHSLFVCADRTAMACGYNLYGQLGDGTTTDRWTPMQVSSLTGIVAVSAGELHSLFLKNDSTAWACGYNWNGRLGDGTTTNRITPVQVSSLMGIVAVVAGVVHSFFMKNDGTAWACGYNAYGQLGDGTNTDRWTPVQVTGLCALAVEGIEEEVNEAGFSIYPNPNSGIFQLTVDNLQSANSRVEIYNARGEKVKNIPLNVFREGGLAVDLSHQPAGVYFVRVTAGNKTIATEKLVIANH
jgi:hypothetical protein